MVGVPSNIISPFVGVEFDNSKAVTGPALVPVQLLVIGQRLSTGAIPELTKFIATTADEVASAAGFGSMLHLMASRVFKNTRTVKAVFLALDDAAGSAKAELEFDVTGTATAAGSLVCYVAGRRYSVAVKIADTAATALAALAALITADTMNLPCTVTVATNTITFVAKNAGLAAGDLDVRFNYNSGELTPAGFTIGSQTLTPGSGDPDIADALAVIGGEWFNVIAHPYADNTNMNSLEDFLATVAGPMEQRDALAYTALRASRSSLITYGTDVANRNSEWCAVLPAYKRMECAYELAAGVAALVASSIQDDPAVPLHRMKLQGFSVLDPNDRWTPVERNQLALSSVATLSDDNGVQTEACVTMYRKNSAGADDTSYQQQNSLFILSALRYRFVNQILSKYPRAKLGDAIDNLGPGQQIMTEDIGKTEAIAWFRQAQRDGLVDPSNAALDQFKKELIVKRDLVNRNRLNFILPPDLMNQFIVGSGVLQFID